MQRISRFQAGVKKVSRCVGEAWFSRVVRNIPRCRSRGSEKPRWTHLSSGEGEGAVLGGRMKDTKGSCDRVDGRRWQREAIVHTSEKGGGNYRKEQWNKKMDNRVNKRMHETLSRVSRGG